MTKSVETVDGVIERIGYDPASGLPQTSVGGRGSVYIILIDDDNVYKCNTQATIIYEEVGAVGDEEWLLLLTQQGDHITFNLEDFNPDRPFMRIKPRSLRNWTLEKRLTTSLKDVTPSDENLPHTTLALNASET